MSTLTVTNIKATGETASRAVSGVAAAWVNFNGTGTIAARDSFNVSSLVDTALGDYKINYSSVFNADNYAATLGVYHVPNITADASITYKTYTASYIEVFTLRGDTSAYFDPTVVSIASTGDLA